MGLQALLFPFQTLRWWATEHTFPTVAPLKMAPGHPQRPRKHSQRQKRSLAYKQHPVMLLKKQIPPPCKFITELVLLLFGFIFLC